MLPQFAKSSCSIGRLTRSGVLAVAVAVAMAAASPSATGMSTPPPAASHSATMNNDSRIDPRESLLALSGDLGLEDLGINDLVSLKITSGKLSHRNRMIVGGEVFLGGSVVLSIGATKATITDLQVNIATGSVKARINGKPLVLGNLATSTLHLHLQAGSRILYVRLGDVEDNGIELSAPAAAELNSILNIQEDEDYSLDRGDEILGGTLKVGVPVDAALADDLNVSRGALKGVSLNTYTVPGRKLHLVPPTTVWRCPPRGSVTAEMPKRNDAKARDGVAQMVQMPRNPVPPASRAVLDAHERAELRLRKENHKLRIERDALKQSVVLWMKDATASVS